MSDLTIITPAHEKDMAIDFLAGLDPSASRFTFQFFSDGTGGHAEIFHGTLDEVWPKVQALNTPQRHVGVFVTIAETDFKGRRKENIVRTRALFVDADSDEQVNRCFETFKACGAAPSMVVKSGKGMHFYFCADVPCDQFSALQKSLIDKVGTDAAVKDLPRVMRLPGTLHLKNPSKPRLVKLYSTENPVRRWKLSKLVAKLGLSAATAASNQAQRNTANIAQSKNGFAAAEMPPLDWEPIIKNCPFFLDALKNGGVDHSQGLWNLTVLACTFLQDGDKLAHKLGNKHVGYATDSTKAMWDRKVREKDQKGLGWPSCNAIQTEGCKLCATCKHFGKIKSPLNLALPTALPDQKKVISQAKKIGVNPVSALLKLHSQGANIATLLAAMNETYAVVKYGNEILVASIIGNDISFMDERNFHRMFANLVIFQNPVEVALRKIKERIDFVGNNIISMTVEDFQEKFADLVIVDRNPIKVSRYWFNAEERRFYLGRGVVFEPGGQLETPNDMINMWRGFGIEPKPGDWSLLRNHILNVVCSGQREHYDYLIKWMAYAVKHPNEPIGVAVAFRGAQGAGKGIVARTFGKFFGKHFAHIANGDQLTGRFNASLATSCAVFLDEALWAGDKKGEGVLKALITEPKLQLEAKFRDPIMVDNRLRIIVASNNDWIAPVGMGDRRWFILDVANTYAGTEHQKYWAALYAEIDTGGAAAMFHDLLAMDLRGFDVRAVPHTSAKAQQQAHSLAGTEAWLYHVLQEGAIGCEPWQNTGLAVSTDYAYLCFEDYSKRQRDWRPDRKDSWSKKCAPCLARAWGERGPAKTGFVLSSSRRFPIAAVSSQLMSVRRNSSGNRKMSRSQIPPWPLFGRLPRMLVSRPSWMYCSMPRSWMGGPRTNYATGQTRSIHHSQNFFKKGKPKRPSILLKCEVRHDHFPPAAPNLDLNSSNLCIQGWTREMPALIGLVQSGQRVRPFLANLIVSV
jgi:hypothetical protein